ncbi:MAG: MCE family protein [Kiritimatiellae bacterium]|nr:MCE family protein [Kiritimatiellia bacterium]
MNADRVFGRRLAAALGGCAVVLVCGCERRAFRAYFEDARDLSVPANVERAGVVIGRVDAIHCRPKRVRVDFSVAPEHAGRVGHGMKARIARKVFGLGGSVLKVYGEPDPAVPATLREGRAPNRVVVALPFWACLPPVAWAVPALACVGLLMARRTRKVAGCLLAAALLGAGAWFLAPRWKDYRDRIVAPSMEKRLDQLAEKTVQSPEAADAWEDILDGMDDVLAGAQTQGKAAARAAAERLCEALEERAAALKQRGKNEAAADLLKLRDRIRETWREDTAGHAGETGDWKLETRNWKLETGNWRLEPLDAGT